MHLTYAFWQTWHLMDQTWHFCIGTMAWHFWYSEFHGLLVVRDLPTRCGSFPWGLLLPARTLLSRAMWTLRPTTSWTTGAWRNSGELRLCGLADREAAIHRNNGDLRLRGLATTGDGNSRAEEKYRAKRAKQKKTPDKNSWVHYFWEMPSQKCQTLGDGLIFPLAKRLGTWQIPTNGKFQLHNCWRCSKWSKRYSLYNPFNMPCHQRNHL